MLDHQLKCMRKAIFLANIAKQQGETPVGAVIVRRSDGKIIATGYNKREEKNDATSHAEIEAIRKAGRKLGDWRLNGCDIYVTLEPCLMCAGAIVQSRIDRVFYGAYDPKSYDASCGIVADIFTISGLNKQVEVYSGIMKELCGQILSDFFKQLRK